MDDRNNMPGNVSRVEDSQALVVLGVVDAKVLFETNDLRVADVGSIEKGAQEQQGQKRQDPGNHKFVS